MPRRKRIHGKRRRRSPFKNKWMDRLQTGLSVAGTVFPQADALNALVSGGRSAYNLATGDKERAKRFARDAAINTAAIIPGVGEMYKAGKAGKLVKHLKTKRATLSDNQITDAAKSLKNFRNIKTSTKKAKDAVNMVSTGANALYWQGTGSQIKKDATGGYKKASDKII
mgnify:CR=1 FL=1